jgi:hypothetical protein
MPFEIEIKEFDSFNQTSITRLNNVLVVKMATSFLAGDLIIIESMNCEAENIVYTL